MADRQSASALLAAPQDLVRAAAEILTGQTEHSLRVRWAQSLSYVRAHAVPVDASERDHHGRPIADGLCGYPGLVDTAGLTAAVAAGDDNERRHCHGCQRLLAGKPLLP